MSGLPDIDQGHVEGLFTGQLLRELGPDLFRETLLEFREGHEVEKIQAACRQKVVASEENMRARRMVDGIGQLRLRVDLHAYLYWEMRKPGCWADKQFRAEFWRDNPECRVNTVVKACVIGGIKATGTKAQSGGGLLVAASKYARVEDVRKRAAVGVMAERMNIEVTEATTECRGPRGGSALGLPAEGTGRSLSLGAVGWPLPEGPAS